MLDIILFFVAFEAPSAPVGNSGLLPGGTDFHENPELPREEFLTAGRIEKELKSFGLETKRVD